MQYLCCVLVSVAIRELRNVVLENHMKYSFLCNINRVQHYISLHLGEWDTVTMAKETELSLASGSL